MSIERVNERTKGKGWFQLYNPVEETLCDVIIDRAEADGCAVLAMLCDVSTIPYRLHYIGNGLALTPKFQVKYPSYLWKTNLGILYILSGLHLRP